MNIEAAPGEKEPRPNNGEEVEFASASGGSGAVSGPGGGNGQAGRAAVKVAVVKARRPAVVELPLVEPWPEAVNGEALLEALVKELERFVVFPRWAAVTLALWIVHTFAFRLREVTTYIGIESPEKECGKSTLVTVLSQFVDRPAVSSNISSSAFFRVIEALEPTLLIDEADTNLRGKDDLMGILNSGYTKPTGFVWRICYDPLPGAEAEEEPPPAPDERGERALTGSRRGRPRTKGGRRGASSAGRVVRYSSWCPKAIATIGPLHPTLASRCIVIRMHRKSSAEECERLKWLDAGELKRKCARFVADHGQEIRKAEPEIPEGLTNRAADIWEPLLALADLAGGRWPKLAREAAVGLTARAQGQSPIGSLLLDILLAFEGAKTGRLFSRDLVATLAASGDRPWVELRRGKPITETWLSQQLRPYGIRPRTIRIGEEVAKGYLEGDLLDTFRRYIPRAEVEALKAEVAEQQGAEGETDAGSEAEGDAGVKG